MAAAMGKVLGAALCTAVDSAVMLTADATVSSARQQVLLPVDPPASKEDAERFLHQQEAWLTAVRASRTVPGPVDSTGTPFDELAGASMIKLAGEMVAAASSADAEGTRPTLATHAA